MAPRDLINGNTQAASELHVASCFRCLRNCYPQTNYREYTILVGKCVKYCEGEDSLFTNQGWLLDSELIRHPIDLPEKILCIRLREDFDLEEALLEEKEIMAIFRSTKENIMQSAVYYGKNDR